MRALVIVLDSVGVGGAPDAAKYGDEGANTLGNVLKAAPDLRLLNLCALGLDQILPEAVGCIGYSGQHLASFGRMQEKSAGKDTTTGHWEIAGAITEEPFAVFDKFPDELVRTIEREAHVKFIGNYARSGTTILEELGADHVRTGNPILYTSADSVLQIAAHEEIMPLRRLYEICEVARRHADKFRIGRVIARPFDGASGSFRRSARRHDYSMKPPRTILNALCEAEFPVIGIGKIHDIFAGEGITDSHPTSSNRDGMDKIERLWGETDRGLILVNLVDFDMVFGHRRDPVGYGNALREFDDWLGFFHSKVRPEDLVIITADHGNDPTFRGSDHTREEVPLFVIHRRESRDLGVRSTFSDISASLADFFHLSRPWPQGSSFLQTGVAETTERPSR